ncbi:MAG: NfeD family protein [Alphaproteobacteria bacterium]
MEWLNDLSALVYWNWLALGLLLIMLEMIIPGAAMLWIGAAAIMTGVAVWLFPDIDWKWQIIMFSVLGIVSVTLSRRLFARSSTESSDPSLNNRSEQLVGRVTVLETAIENGQGRARIGDSSWAVTGADMPVGTKVRITAADGAMLQVERAI